MKKILSLLFASCLVVCASAELYTPSRVFEIGFDVGFGADQNLMPVPDLMKKELVLDLSEINDNLDSNGFVFDMFLSTRFFMNLHLENRLDVGLVTELEFVGSFGLGKALFKFLGEGNEFGESIDTSINAYTEVFLSASVPVKFKVRNIGIKVTPSYFIPILYVPQPDATFSAVSYNDGSMHTEVKADFSMYSVYDLSTVFTSDFGLQDDFSFDSSLITEMLSSGGVDLDLEAEYPFFSWLDAGAYMHLPIVPGRLKYKGEGGFSWSATVNPLLDFLLSDDDDASATTMDDPEFRDGKFTTLDSAYSVNRPFRLGVQAALRPFGKWFTFRPLFGFAARNPFGKDFKAKDSMFVEYCFAADLRFLYVFNFSFATEYRNKVFGQSVGIALNFRVMELVTRISFTSADFLKSWQGSGVKAVVGLRFGW